MGGGGASLPFNGAFRAEIRLGADPQRLLFIDSGVYPTFDDPSVTAPFWEKIRHNFKDMRGGRSFFRSFMCPRGKDRSVTCRACTMQYDEDDKRVQSRRTKYFNVISLEWWYKTTNKYGDESWILPTTPAERRRLDADESTERVFGRRGYLALGPGHARHLFEIADQVASTCTNCVEPGQRAAKVFPAAYVCGACESVLEDMETTNLTGDELKDYPFKKTKCGICDHVGLPVVKHECERCGDGAQPTELFDAVIPLAKRGEGTDSRIMVPHGEEIVLIDHFTLEDGSALFDGENFHADIAGKYTPYDFDALFEVEMRPEYQDVRVFG